MVKVRTLVCGVVAVLAQACGGDETGQTAAQAGGQSGEGTVLTELSTGASDNSSWISPDGCWLYLDTTVAGDHDLFVAEMLP